MKYSNCNKSIHGIAHPPSAHCGLPHGIANATTLPYVMGFDVSVLSDKEASDLTIKAVKVYQKNLESQLLISRDNER
ncbi:MULTISPECIES: iron-containing alcohol dehydrogenase [Bacillaceae]|uniref:iron-containing alcohol dehydrogenase n=1 Tax=Bacillaceae TaxID=186817 RepID=UPI001FF08C46|nr:MULTISPECIES: iron-containing alcohol dehydrogenase [Bacillaceae]